MSDKKKESGNVKALFKGMPLPSDEPEVDQRLVEVLKEMVTKAEKGEITFIAYLATGHRGFMISNFAGSADNALGVAQGLRCLDQEWQEMAILPAWYGDYEDE